MPRAPRRQQPGLYVLPQGSKVDLTAARERFDGCHKLLSIIYLRSLGLPTLDGFVVDRWSPAIHEEALRFAKERGWQQFLLRHDRREETHRSPRGGYLFELTELEAEARRYLNEGRLLILLEPRSPYDDVYSVNALLDDSSPTGLLEVVGPGFDASDLQRGDLTPHERIQFKMEPLRRGTSEPSRLIEDRQTVGPEPYRQSIRVRLEKIGRRVFGAANETAGREYLERNGKTLLLEHEQHYNSIPDGRLREVFSLIAVGLRRLPDLAEQSGPFVMSMSVLYPDERLIFWDVVWPRLKYR